MENAWATTRTVIDEGINYPAAVPVQTKGGENTDCVAKTIFTLIKQLCHKRVGVRHDGELAMVARAQKVQINGKGHGVEIQIQQVPAYSHQCNGAAEKAHDLIQRQVWAMRLSFEQRGGFQIRSGFDIWP